MEDKKFQLFLATITIILSCILTPLFSYLFGINPEMWAIIITLSIISTILSLLLITAVIIIFKYVNMKVRFYWNKKEYQDCLEKLVVQVEKLMVAKGIYLASSADLSSYIDRKYTCSNKNNKLDFIGETHQSTTDCINLLIQEKKLEYLESANTFIMKEKLVCNECNEPLIIKDLLDSIHIFCEKCKKEGQLLPQGLFYNNELLIPRKKFPVKKRMGLGDLLF